MDGINKVVICGIPFTIEETSVIDEEECGVVLGKVIHSEAKILIKRGLTEELQKATLWHEMVHALLVLIGRSDLSDDEIFVQTFSSELWRIYQTEIETTEERR